MSVRKKGVKVLKAVGSGIRLQVLTLLYDEGPLTYTEIMTSIKMNQNKDAGKFAYHLKFLLKTDLIEPEPETRKYALTDLGKMIVDIAEEIERHTFTQKKTMVRTSRLAIEEFDRNKIALSLIKEANAPVSLAQKIARETEKRLQTSKTKYITAPLIREIVNTILLEKGLEDYRHKLTRLGIPVYDVAQLIKTKANTPTPSVEAVHKAAGDAVLEEYTLLNALPREIADAHMAGAIHLDNLGNWILKPNEISHDLRYFLKNAQSSKNQMATLGLGKTPKNFETALATTMNTLRNAAGEVAGEQTIDYFNLFLAPFTKSLSAEEVKEKLSLFLYNLNQILCREGTSTPVTLGLELVVPDFLKEKEAAGVEGKLDGQYSDFEEETRRLATIFLEIILEESGEKPVFNPGLVIKLRPEALENNECQPVLLQIHRLATLTSTPCFANMYPESQRLASYAATGTRLGTEWKDDWELDTLQTGKLDGVTINLPRISYLCEGKQAKFFELLDEQLEITARALEIKHQIIKQRLEEGLLPFLSQNASDTSYFRQENATRVISFAGLYEASYTLHGKSLAKNNEALKFAEQTLSLISAFAREHSRKPENRMSCSLVSSAEAARRFAGLDAERFGWAKINAQGGKEQPYYTNVGVLPLNQNIAWQDRLAIEEGFHKLTLGGHATILPLSDVPTSAGDLLATTKQIVTNYDAGLFAYDRLLIYCRHCKRLSYKALPKCQFCGGDSLITFARSSVKYSAA
jgi:anaerobic ribonucleoside-triphosphate reductase/predicted transcriptional regulator